MKYQYSENDVYRLLDSVNAEYRQDGKEIDVTVCPVCHGGHNHDKHTFSININTGLCNCLRSSCGFKGNLMQLARELDFVLTDETEYTIYRQLPKRDIQTTDKAVDYLGSRGISRAVVERYQITTDKRGYVVFPFYTTTNELTFIKYRNISNATNSKEFCQKDCKPILFGMNHANQYDKPLVITEGQIDALSLAEAGVPNPVSVPMGKNNWRWLNFCEEFISRFSEIIVFGDMDNGKMTLVDKLDEEYHGKVKAVRKVDYLGEKDANDILRAYGAEELRRAVASAVPYTPPALINLADVERPNFDDVPKVKTKIKPLDALIDGLFGGQLVLLTGKSGEGKSTLASMLAVRSLEQGYNVFLYSGELEGWQVQGWIDAQVAGSTNITQTQYDGMEEGDDGFISYTIPNDTLSAVHWWYDKRCWLYTNENIPDGVTEQDYLLEAMKQAAVYDDCKFFVIDNMMTVVNEVDKNVSAFDMQTSFAKALKKFAQRHDVIVLLVAHRKKSNGQRGSDDNDFVYGSSNIVNLADTVMTYRRVKDSTDYQGELGLTKNRAYGRQTLEPIQLCYNEASKRVTVNEYEEQRLDFQFTEFRPIAPYQMELRSENNDISDF